MIRLSPASRRYLASHFDDCETGVRAIGDLVAIEIGEDVAEALPTNIADNIGRHRVREQVGKRVNQIIQWLATERDRA